jgi:DNA repair exonuclease SbcCD ATPase subunit
MNTKLISLTLVCRSSRELIEFSPRVTFFHGQIAAGKSSIARLIDFCLGGDLERTPAIQQELVSVELAAEMGRYEVLFEREARSSNQVQVTWQNAEGERATVLAPLQASPTPIWGENVFNLSDLIFYLYDITPMKVRKSKANPESPLVRLSFRDMMWYCYLDQDQLDSSFYRLGAEESFRRLKSRDVMRFVVGYYTERLQDLEVRLEEVTSERASKREAADRIGQFLQEFGYGSLQAVESEVQKCQQEQQEADAQLQQLRERQGRELPHIVDELRPRLREMAARLAQEEEAEADLQNRISEQESLRAELISAKFKMARADSAAGVLAGVKFVLCPSCGSKLPERDKAVCGLCGQPPQPHQAEAARQADLVEQDLTSRIEELEESLRHYTISLKKQEKAIVDLRHEKAELDQRLTTELREYDSAFLAHAREVERQVATLEEKLRHLNQVKGMVEAVARLREQADALTAEEERLRRERQDELAGLTNADQCVRALEQAYLQALLAVGVPGVGTADEVHISRQTWIPSIWPEGDQHLQWNFYNAGSGGKKTLMNVCYALAVHRVAANRKLPLPTFLMIDTPMKNISEDVNRNLFEAFYRYLYDLAVGDLSNTQFIIIDKECLRPPEEDVSFQDRYMTPEDDTHPPLISYYRGQ